MTYLYSVNIRFPAQTQINIVQGMVMYAHKIHTYNTHTKFELNKKHRLETSMFLMISPKAVIYKNSFSYSSKKTVYSKFTKMVQYVGW